METESDRTQSENGRRGDRRAPSLPHKQPTSPAIQEDRWIQHGLNRVEERIGDIGKDVGDLRERAKASEEKLDLLPGIERRLRRLEYFAWVAVGVLLTCGVVWAVLQFFLSMFDITIAPKS